VAFADDFSDGPEEDPAPPLLPREDRIWRHPSELGAAEQPFVLDPLVVRRRWLSSQPTRASAWTAGLVGALLATGLVVLGTHLASAFTQAPDGAGTAPSQPATPVSTLADTSELQLSPPVAAVIDRVAASTATVETTVDGRDAYSDAVVLSGQGDLLVPLSAVAGTQSALVTLPGDDAAYVGQVVATDADSGVAVLRIRGAGGLPVAPFATSTPAPGELVYALGRSGAPTALGAMIDSVGGTSGPDRWPVALTADIPASRAPAGTPLIGDGGAIVGIVEGAAHGGGVEALPAWLAAPVAQQLVESGKVLHGWIGISCVNLGKPAGAEVRQVLGTPAAGLLRQGDVIVALDGLRTPTFEALQSRLYALPAGSIVQLTVQRGAAQLTIDLRLGSSR